MEIFWLLGVGALGLGLMVRDWRRERLLVTARQMLQIYWAQAAQARAITSSEDAPDAGD